MSSSGMKRGLAASAISALAVAGLPFLASSASATPITSVVGDDAVVFYSQNVPGISDENDGTNTTVSLVVGGGKNVTSVLFQYQDAASATPLAWIDVPGGLVSRNADGVFAADWSGVPDTVTDVRAVPNTGVANAVNSGAKSVLDAAAHTVELGSEGALGVFQSPYTEAGHDGDYVGVTGTVSADAPSVTVSDASHGTTGADTTTIATPATGAKTTTFDSVLDITGYPYSAGTEANQIALNAATDNTDDAEGSTLYVQKIGKITATPTTQDQVDPSKSEILITVTDTTGKPVAGAQVMVGADTDTDGTGPDTDTDGAERLVGYTDGKGQIVDDQETTASTFVYYVNTTDNDAYEAGIDPSTSATVTTYTPVLGSVDIVNNRDRSNYDLDELVDGDDFTIVTKDQKGAPYNEDLVGNDVEYRWVVDPSGAGNTVTSPWMGGETDAKGEFPVPGISDADYATWTASPTAVLPEGSYTLEARRPNVSGAGLMNATPETVTASESEISYAEGKSANAPVNGEFTVDGTLANDNGGLGDREVKVTYTPTGDSSLAPQASQPAGVTVTSPTTANVITDAKGNFSVKLTDPKVPANVDPTEEKNNNLNSHAYEAKGDTTDLQGNNGADDSTVANDPDNAEQDLTVNFVKQAAAASVSVDIDKIVDGVAGPGAPVDLDITVTDANKNVLTDYPVEVSVNKGFLSPNAETDQQLTLADGHNKAGDLWGYFAQLGTSKTVSTGDAGEAGIVAAMERDTDFDDDGLSTMTITVKAGSVTETRNVTFDDRVLLNLSKASLDRAADEPTGDVKVPGEVDFQLYTVDQFGNLAGDQIARISDDSTVADFRTDESFDQTLSDFTTSGPGITAFSNAPTVQTLMASMTVDENLVAANGGRAKSTKTAMAKSAPINWVANDRTIEPRLNGRDNAENDDHLKVNAPSRARGAVAKLYKIKDGVRTVIAKAKLDSKGDYRFTVADKNGKKRTKYIAKVGKTSRTDAAWTNKKSVR